MDDHPSQVFIAALADAEQLGLPAGRVFARHEAEPRSAITSLAELTSRPCRRQQSGRGQRTDARHGHQVRWRCAQR